MSALSDSNLLLDEANRQLNLIEQYYLDSLSEKHISLILRLKIKHFLEDCRSSLDYAAFYVFNKFCKERVTSSLEDHERIVNFPFKDVKNKFDKYVINAFPGLTEQKPDIVSVFEKVQSFNSQDNMKWFYYLNDLCNKKKHRKLAHEERIKITHIRHMEDVFGNVFENCTFTNCGQAITYDGVPVDIKKPQSNPYVKSLNATEWVHFIFTDLNQPVLPTLKDIYSGTSEVINDLEQLL